MSHNLRRPRARRALGVSTTDLAGGSTHGEDLTVKGLISHSLAALAISTLGLAVAGSVALTSSAQAVESPRSATSSTQSGDRTAAQPAAQAPRGDDRGNAPTDQKVDKRTDEGIEGALDVFARTADGSSRNAVRNAIDGAVADQEAKDRGVTLDESDDQAATASGMTTADARGSELNNASQANKREQTRLAEEKKKADEALKAASAPEAGNLPPAPPAPVGTGGGVTGGAATPMAPGSYTVAARWGAVGSWSRYHTGQDLPAPIGTPIRSAAAGVVLSSNGGGWAGTHAVIKHSDGSATLYAHMSTMLVHPGQPVAPGQQIGAVGMTGRTFGPHLHFEHYPQAGSVGNPYTTDDPASWMMRQGVRL